MRLNFLPNNRMGNRSKVQLQPLVRGFLLALFLTLNAATIQCNDRINLVKNSVLDLSGEWKITLDTCLETESVCLKRISEQNTFTISVPSNIHSTIPWFFGKMRYTHEFITDNTSANLLFLGSIGSVDKVYLNGKLLGGEGFHEEGFSLSSYNTIREYRVPQNVLQIGANQLEIEVYVLDVKGGIHTGPILFGNREDVAWETNLAKLVREYIFIAVPIVLIMVLIVFSVTVPIWRPGEGNVWIALSFFGYCIHSLNFLPVPWSGDYLTFLKIQWIGRIASKVFSFLYFYYSFGLRFRYRNEIAIGGFLFLSAITVYPDNYLDYFGIERMIHLSFFGILFLPIYWKRSIVDDERWNNWRHYLALVGPVLLFYTNDALVRFYVLNTPWMFHYFSLVNIISFLSLFIYHIYLWKEESKIHLEKKIAVQKLEIAHEIHDIIGSDLSQVYAMTQDSKNHKPALIHAIRNSLDRIRDFSRVLKNEETIKSVPELIDFYGARLSSISRIHFRKTVDQRIRDVALKPMVLLHMERILSEWISNILKHSHPEQVTIQSKINPTEKYLTLVIRNSPATFAWNGEANIGGLHSIATRTRSIHGRVRCFRIKQESILILRIPIPII